MKSHVMGCLSGPHDLHDDHVIRLPPSPNRQNSWFCTDLKYCSKTMQSLAWCNNPTVCLEPYSTMGAASGGRGLKPVQREGWPLLDHELCLDLISRH